MIRKIRALALLMLPSAAAMANNADNFREHDNSGLMMTIIAMGVVFSALLILFICFKWADKILNVVMYQLFVRPYKAMRSRLRHDKQTTTTAAAHHKDSTSETVATDGNEQLAAAIGVAMFLAEDGMHDRESDILTLASQTTPAWTGVGRNQKQQPLRKF